MVSKWNLITFYLTVNADRNLSHMHHSIVFWLQEFDIPVNENPGKATENSDKANTKQTRILAKKRVVNPNRADETLFCALPSRDKTKNRFWAHDYSIATCDDCNDLYMYLDKINNQIKVQTDHGFILLPQIHKECLYILKRIECKFRTGWWNRNELFNPIAFTTSVYQNIKPKPRIYPPNPIMWFMLSMLFILESESNGSK